jgi:hypothetical protein
MIRTKEIYYRNTSYKISIDDLKHINGYDVAKLPNEIYVYYDDLDSKWKLATKIQIEEYTGKRYIEVEFNGNMIESLSYLDLYEEIENKRVTKINVEYVVVYDSDKDRWEILNQNDELYKKYMNIYKK